MDTSKIYTIYAGVNGAGKSTFYRSSVFKENNNKRVNADEILKEKGGDWRNSRDQMNAMKEAVRRIHSYFKEGISFNQESTLVGNSIIKNIKRAKELGYIINVYFIGLDSPDLAIQRVQIRVQNGGHGIAEYDIRRRYYQSLQNLKVILPICDNVEIFDNTEKLIPVATYSHNKLVFVNKCVWLQELDLEEFA